jgi:hypothetical protein
MAFPWHMRLGHLCVLKLGQKLTEAGGSLAELVRRASQAAVSLGGLQVHSAPPLLVGPHRLCMQAWGHN